jgi:hypothetical protein
MSDEQFIFEGQTTFINKPRETVIRDFQNTYLRGDGSSADEINTQLEKLIELSLSSKDLPDADREETVQAIHAVAEQVRDDKVSRLSLKGTLEAVQGVVSKAADIAGPAIVIIGTVLKLAGLA